MATTLTSPGRHAAGIVGALTLALAVVFIAFALPAVKSGPHDVPLGVAGPGASAAQLEEHLPGGFLVTNYGDEAALRTAILHREVYGGIVVTAQGPRVLIASGAGPTIAQSLQQVTAAISPTHAEDLAPLPAGDARGVGLAAAALPITLAGLLPAVALLIRFPDRPWLRLGAFTAAALLMTLTIAALLRFVFGSIDAHFWAVSAGLLLGVLAMGLPVLGLGSLFGRVGLAIGAAVAVLLGNPLSGLASAPELLPRGWGAFGQLLPQGANATLLRSTAYFPEPFTAGPVTVLACWVVAGLLLITLAAQRHSRSER